MKTIPLILALLAGFMPVAITAAEVPRPKELPPIQEVIFGVNQLNVGLPGSAMKSWPLTDADAEWLKSLGCNTIRFPVYPGEVGIDEKRFLTRTPDGKFDPAALGAGDWRSLDELMDWMIRHQFTPNVCPSPEFQTPDWTSKTWMSLHVPENAERAVWFTKLVMDHLTEKYGSRILYGWYEDWWWNSYKHEDSACFPEAFRWKLSEMYDGKIAALNAAWESTYGSFAEVEVPALMSGGPESYNRGTVAPAAVNSRRTFDLRKAMDLLHREVLTELRDYLHKKAPGALWTGPCILNQLGGLSDIRTASVPRCNATMRTAAITSDIMSADLYSDTLEYYSHYRTYSKFAAAEGKKLLIAEVPAIKPRSFQLVADVGGPSAGALAWCGKWDLWGLIKDDGTRREENGKAWRKLYDTYQSDRARYAKYHPGSIHVYFPEETLSYSISDLNFIDAFMNISDHMKPGELELVLTDELFALPTGTPIYVIERTLPLAAIQELERRGGDVVTLHDWFMDENGRKHLRKTAGGDVFKRLLTLPGGEKLLDVFQRVEERANSASFSFDGARITSPSALAEANAVLPDRPNRLENLINGDTVSGITFSDRAQEESFTIQLAKERRIYGAFMDFFSGDGQFNAPSRMPERVIISVSDDGKEFKQVAAISGKDLQMRSRCRFVPVAASWVRFDFGTNESGSGLRLVNAGVLGQPEKPQP